MGSEHTNETADANGRNLQEPIKVVWGATLCCLCLLGIPQGYFGRACRAREWKVCTTLLLFPLLGRK